MRMLRGSKAARAALPLLAAGIAVVVCGSGSAAQPGKLTRIFERAAARYQVPEPILLTEGYVNTRLEMPARPLLGGRVGITALTPVQVREGAKLIHSTPRAVRRNAAANIRAGAALLARLRPHGAGLAAWYAPLSELGGPLYAQEVYDTLRLGFSITVGGERVALPPTQVRLPARATAATQRRADYPDALWHAASRANYTPANRPLSHKVDMIVIHVTEGSYAGAINWFADPRAQASAHYVVRSIDGQVTQVVHEKDIAWHAGNWKYNLRSVGIEHEAIQTNCHWFTDAMYRSSAQLAAYLAAKYLIPIDRRHIIGHSQVPDPNNPHLHGGADHHTDPGPCWNWPKYMALVRSFAQARFANALQRIADDARRTAFTAPRGWTRKSSRQSYAGSYALTHSSSTGKPAQYTLHVPRTGSYALYSWWPAAASRSPAVPVGVGTATGREWVPVNERKGSGWRYLGTFYLSGVTHILVSPRTNAPGTIAADAFKVELLSRRFQSRLVTGNKGWILSKAGLSRTADGGAVWQTIAPPDVAPQWQTIRGADWSGQTAYVAVAGGTPTAPIRLERTANGGASWSSSILPLPPSADVAGPVEIQPLDSQHIFVTVRLEPNSHALSRGLLLRSSDGGQTWVSNVLPAGGDVSFTSATTSWLVGGFDRESLYRTLNGGRTWSPVTPNVGVAGAYGAAYDSPVFLSASDGVVPVSLPAGNRSALAFSTTMNGGRSWKQAAVVHTHTPLDLGQTVPSSIADADTWFAAARGNLVSVTGGGMQQTTVGPLPPGVSALDFTSAQTGWAQAGGCSFSSCSAALYGTQDGGLTWNRITLP